MNFFTKHIRPETKGEKMNSMTKTETAGYVSPEKQITNLLHAGVRLGEYRKELFDIVGTEGVEEVPIVRMRNFDMADASEELRSISARNAERKRIKAEEEEIEKAEVVSKIDNGTVEAK